MVQPLADGMFMHLNRKATRDLLTQINAPPAHDLIRLRIRTVDNQVPQLRHLCLTQLRPRASADPRGKPRQALGIVPMNPVTQRLPLHTAHLRRFRPRVALQDQRKGKKPPDNPPVLVLRHQTPQIRRRICQIRHCDRSRHRPSRLPKRPRPANHNSPRRGNPARVKNRGGWYYTTGARRPRCGERRRAPTRRSRALPVSATIVPVLTEVAPGHLKTCLNGDIS